MTLPAMPSTIYVVVLTATNGAYENVFSMWYPTREMAQAAIDQSENDEYLPSKGLVTLKILEYHN